MTTGNRAAFCLGATLLAATLTLHCGGDKASSASKQETPAQEQAAATEARAVNASQELNTLSPAIPIYPGAQYRDDLTRRDVVTIRSRYGNGAEVYTMATDDSFPQVYHYYTTYLAQFRAFPASDTYPPKGKEWRTMEVQLNQAMQDPFIPGQSLNPRGKQVILQVAETEAEPRTVIRYIITPAGTPPPMTLAQNAGAPPAPALR
jgi:hypothetical protein